MVQSESIDIFPKALAKQFTFSERHTAMAAMAARGVRWAWRRGEDEEWRRFGL